MLRPIDSKGRIGTRVLMIPTLRRVSSILSLTRRLAHTPAALLLLVSLSVVLAAVINDAVHRIIPTIGQFVRIEPEARAPPRTSTLALVVASQGIAARKPTAALWTCVWAFPSVQFRMSFQVVETSETRLASRTFIRLFLAVGQEMALQVVMSRKVGRAVRAFVTFCRWRFGTALRIAGKAHLTCGGTWIVFWCEWTRKRECAVAGPLTRIRSDGLVMRLRRVWRWWRLRLLLLLVLLRLLLLLLRRTLGLGYGHRSSSGLQRSHRGRCSRVGRAEAGEAHGTCLHGITSHAGLFGNDEGLGGLFERGAHLCGLRRRVFRSTRARLIRADEALDNGNSRVWRCLSGKILLAASFVVERSRACKRLR